MKFFAASSLSIALLFSLPNVGSAQDFIPLAKRLEPISDVQPPSLIYSLGIASSFDWPATYVLGYPQTIDVYGDKFRLVCTATAVSPNVVLTAAHCLRHFTTGAENMTSGQSPDFQIDTGNSNIVIKAYCNKPSSYHPKVRSPSDWALCKLDTNLPIDNFETIALELSRKENPDVALTLLGFGCIGFHGAHPQVYGGIEGKDVKQVLNYGHKKYLHYDRNENLYFGEAVVTEDADGFFVTRKGALLCPGDSGGAAYSGSKKSGRRIVGINSQALLGAEDKAASYIAQTTSRDFSIFAKSWAIKNSVYICGINSNSPSCN